MSLSARSRASTPFYVSTNVRVYCKGGLPLRRCVFVCMPVCVRFYTCVYMIYTHIYTEHPLFPVCRLAEVGDPEGGSKRGGARDAGGENKLISLTQPAVTPPQHDINPKPWLSLFKLYESLCRQIGEGEELCGRLCLSVFLSLSPHSFDLIFPRW